MIEHYWRHQKQNRWRSKL